MAVQKIAVLEQGFHFYIGLSTDTKPDASTVPFGSKFWEHDNDEFYMSNGSSWVQTQESIKRIAGERDEDSTTGQDHIAVSEEFAISDAIDLSNNASTTVYNGPALFGGIFCEADIATAAITIDDDTTTRFTVPTGIGTGSYLTERATIFETSLVVNPADATTGTIRVWYRPLDSSVTWAY